MLLLVNVHLDVWEALLHLAAGVLEDLQGRLGHLLIIHLEAAQQGLKRLRRVERHRVGKRQHLGFGGGHDSHTTILEVASALCGQQ